MAENNHQRTLALRAPRGVVFDRDGGVLVENRRSYSISIVREHTNDLDRTVGMLASVLGIDEARSARSSSATGASRRTGRSRRAGRDARAGRGRDAPADFELPDVVVEQVPTRQYPSTRWRRTCSATSAKSTKRSVAGRDAEERRHRRPAGHREDLQRPADGRGRRPARRRQQRRPRNQHARRGDRADRRQAAAADDRRRRPARGRGRLHGVRLQRRRGGARSAERRGAGVHEPAGLRPERVCGRHRSRDLGGAQHRRAPAAERSRDSGALFARARPSRWRSRRRRSRKA